MTPIAAQPHRAYHAHPAAYRALAALAVGALLAGCGGGSTSAAASPVVTPAPGDAAQSATPAPKASEKPATPGRLLITLTGETLARNSAGAANSTACQLTPTATNDSAVEIKSLHAEFTVRTLADGAALPRPAVLTMPIRIAPGATQPAWGPIYLDDHRCEDLSIQLNPTLPGACRTVDQSPCPAYALAATGITAVN